MAANTHMSIASWNLALNAALDTPLASGFLDIYDSTGTGQPATPDTAVTTQVKLAHLPLSATAYGAAASGVKTANAITNGTGLAAGTATWFRQTKSDGTAVIDGSAGTSGTDLTLNDASITVGGTVSVTSLTVSMPAAQ
jgi:hypothetical protein